MEGGSLRLALVGLARPALHNPALGEAASQGKREQLPSKRDSGAFGLLSQRKTSGNWDFRASGWVKREAQQEPSASGQRIPPLPIPVLRGISSRLFSHLPAAQQQQNSSFPPWKPKSSGILGAAGGKGAESLVQEARGGDPRRSFHGIPQPFGWERTFQPT